ncbi:MAG: hypothetical protein WAN48_08165, partial [Actinomycetes bacterium]
MSLSGLLSVLRPDPAVSAAVEAAHTSALSALEVSGPTTLPPFLVAAIASGSRDGVEWGSRPVLAVTATGREAEDLVAALRSLLPADQVADFPAWETLPHERLSPRSDTVGRRLAVLRRL